MAKVSAEEHQPLVRVEENCCSRPDNGKPPKCHRLCFLHLQVVETFGQLLAISGQQTRSLGWFLPKERRLTSPL
jgi:hypothetical protein